MFCDLVGSTSLAAKLDAEDWRNLVNAYLDEASTAVTGFGGHVLKKLGDGLMALFGYPHAQENDAERAVRAALAIQRALADLNARNPGKGAPELSARIGLDSGPVVVDATGEVFGEAPNLAARVQAAAEPGSVLVTGSVQRQVAGLFVVEEKGAHELKGVAQPLIALSSRSRQRRRPAGRRARADPASSAVRTSSLFSDAPLGARARRRRPARADRRRTWPGQVAAGRGVSRQTRRRRRTPGSNGSPSQLLQNTPLHPIAEWGRQRFGGPTRPPNSASPTSRTLWVWLASTQPNTRPCSRRWSISCCPGSGGEIRAGGIAATATRGDDGVDFAGARTQPAVLAFEDLHWADPTSLDLLRALAERGAQAPLLIIATARPEFRPPWTMRSHHSVISLAPLDRAQVAPMVGEISARHALSDETWSRG